MQIIPAATVPVDGICTPIQNSLVYIPTEDGGSYTISFCLGNNTGTLAPGPKCLTPGGIIDRDCFVCGDQISAETIAGHTCNTGAPDYDKCTYNTVLIGDQCWMKENLNVGTMVLGSVNQGNYSAGIQKYCYNNNLLIADNVTPHNYCATDGGLYQLHMAMAKNQSCDAVDCTASPSDVCCSMTGRGICPIGWHLPSDVEQNTLENYLKDSGQTCDANRQAGYDCATAGTKMKNAAGFSCLLVGRRNSNNTFTGWGTYGRFWSVSTIGLDAWYRLVYSGNTTVGRYHLPRTYGLPVRCIKD
ncbi:hypothetical protein COT98_00170 [Candidatus Falkowbacteria bacterium CG10_big_fil_rev_8_21_14_0_10_39_9]|uniref:Fibrobacter succinogenes major paralogous domain-containing protein n=1 Tax=Candidatus Falkowbacteria bacterium CG10_big_fil_rev_8_21_14_0_10_39_9 TaxID=1974566 RepID=A0A2M6WRN5_9BACT|nr:MAG: hypothetical protein COT98_00170 [Candidatus Falkowbacteria bacterium CG10_big_fil_rev_8_21_14_0_10_39_9]